MCDVPSIAVFCSESVECFPGIIIIIIIVDVLSCDMSGLYAIFRRVIHLMHVTV